MLFGKYINKYYKKYWFYFLIGLISLIIVDVVQTFIPRYLGQIIDKNNELVMDLGKVGTIVGRIMICAVIMFLGRMVWRLSLLRAARGIEANLREDMFKKAESMSASYYHETKAGNIMNWFTSDIEEIGEFFGWGTVMIIDAIFLSASVLVSMVNLSPWMTLIALLPIALIIVWGMIVDRVMSARWEYRQKEYDRLYDFTTENFSGIRVIKSFVKQNQEIHAFAKIARKNQETNVGFARLSVFFNVIIEIILTLEMSMLLGFGGWFVYAAATGTPIQIFGQSITLTVGELMEFVGYVDLLVWPMIALGEVVSMRSRAKGSLKRISAFLATTPDVINPLNGVKLTSGKGEIEFRNFSFSYPSVADTALSEVNMHIRPGEHIGIVGKIGSGKTTLVQSLFRFYNVAPGTLYIDGVDVMEADIPSLRNQLAYAPQDNFLFSDSIEGNIAFSSDTVDAKKVVEAACFADVDANIKGFPKGYETILGERGMTLSGGQKQRVSVARAFYKSSPILVLDDCVSAVDLKTEETMLRNIAEQRKGLTTLLVASRVSSVASMDRIAVLDQGKLIGFGTHAELLSSCPEYKKMVVLQQLEREVEGGER